MLMIVTCHFELFSLAMFCKRLHMIYQSFYAQTADLTFFINLGLAAINMLKMGSPVSLFLFPLVFNQFSMVTSTMETGKTYFLSFHSNYIVAGSLSLLGENANFNVV